MWAQQSGIQHQVIPLDFTIDPTSETASFNPFLDYRLQVIFHNGANSYSVPGYYAADGNAAETSASAGGIWRVNFTPDYPGEWTYEVFFKKGKNVAIDDDIYSGEPITRYDGYKGTLSVAAASPNAKGFAHSGRLQYDDSGYFSTISGRHILKFGANSPENFLACSDIDGTYSYDPTKNFLKSWSPHIRDWREGDPSWQNGKGKGIIGALNYLASKGMNSVYALSLNIEGDARDIWPFLSHHRRDFKRYDVSKLAQWDIIFTHAEQLGIIIQLVTQEKENELILDNGDLDVERKLYYRELIARFAHHKNIIWNMGEENGLAPFWPQGQSHQQRFSMIRYIHDHDPYHNPVVIHTMSEPHEKDEILSPLLRFDRLDGLSMQISNVSTIHEEFLKWSNKSKENGRKWILSMDEIGPWHTGTQSDQEDPDHDTLRKEVLWGTLMAGGAGVEWYFGWHTPENDLNAENWRSRNNMWEQTYHAKSFFDAIPYPEMSPMDDLLSNKQGYCLGKSQSSYAVYLPYGGTTTIDLTGDKESYDIWWYNPKSGGEYARGSVVSVAGGKNVYIGYAPHSHEKDWAIVLIKK